MQLYGTNQRNVFGTSGVEQNQQTNTSETKKQEGVGDSELDQDDFLHLLITQLQNQDPSSPMDTDQLLQQTTMFAQLDQMTSMNESITNLTEILLQQSSNNSSLLTGSSFLGKEIEFATNTITFDGSAVTNFQFYLGGTPASGSSTEIRIFNEEGELVSTYRPGVLKKGENTIPWDGIGEGGVVVSDGTYTFEVLAYDAEGKLVEFESFGKGIVESVKMANGILYFGVDGGVVSSEYVYAVSDPKPDPEDPDTEDPDTEDPDTEDPDKPDTD